jgi:hypothetical protein
MVELGEWSVIVEVPADTSDGAAGAVSEAVTAALRGWATAAERQLGEELGVRLRVRSNDLAGT